MDCGPTCAERVDITTTSEQPSFDMLKQALDGKWLGEEGETYHVKLDDGTCFRHRRGYWQTSHLHYKAHDDKVWWGNYYLEVAHACTDGDRVAWRHWDTSGSKDWQF